jgi:hypothetical protein
LAFSGEFHFSALVAGGVSLIAAAAIDDPAPSVR